MSKELKTKIKHIVLVALGVGLTAIMTYLSSLLPHPDAITPTVEQPTAAATMTL